MKVWWALVLAGLLIATLALVTYFAPVHGEQGRQGLTSQAAKMPNMPWPWRRPRHMEAATAH